MTIELSVNNETQTLAAKTLLGDALQQWGYGDSKIADPQRVRIRDRDSG